MSREQMLPLCIMREVFFFREDNRRKISFDNYLKIIMLKFDNIIYYRYICNVRISTKIPDYTTDYVKTTRTNK